MLSPNFLGQFGEQNIQYRVQGGKRGAEVSVYKIKEFQSPLFHQLQKHLKRKNEEYNLMALKKNQILRKIPSIFNLKKGSDKLKQASLVLRKENTEVQF